MKNPFLQFERFRNLSDVGGIDQKENRTTEYLAACFVFSRNILNRFLKLAGISERLSLNQEVDVATQFFAEQHGILDLLISSEGVFHIIVEAKVSNTAEREGQIIKYRQWLELRRLRLHGIIERLPQSHRYRLTPSGLKTALFYTRLSQRLLRPGLSLLHDPRTTQSSPMAVAYRRFEQSVDDFTALAIQKLVA